jgi:hypothetical protein
VALEFVEIIQWIGGAKSAGVDHIKCNRFYPEWTLGEAEIAAPIHEGSGIPRH